MVNWRLFDFDVTPDLVVPFPLGLAFGILFIRLFVSAYLRSKRVIL